jgi:hypothetical protein
MNDNISILLLNALPDKKIKSIGNKGLIKLYKNINLIDYQINLFQKIFKNPEIIIVGGFESKKLQKYLKSKPCYSDIKYIDHNVTDISNIGESIEVGLKLVTNNKILIHNCSILLDNDILSLIKKNKRSFVLSQKDKGKIGCINNNGYILNCFYDLSDRIYESAFFDSNELMILKNNCNNKNINFHKLYFFEILNLCIHDGGLFQLLYGNKNIYFEIENLHSIKSLQRLFKKKYDK